MCARFGNFCQFERQAISKLCKRILLQGTFSEDMESWNEQVHVWFVRVEQMNSVTDFTHRQSLYVHTFSVRERGPDDVEAGEPVFGYHIISG